MKCFQDFSYILRGFVIILAHQGSVSGFCSLYTQDVHENETLEVWKRHAESVLHRARKRNFSPALSN